MGVGLRDHGGGIAVLTLHDPERRNALTMEMGEQLQQRCRELAADPTLRAVVLTGTPPAFSAGGDLDLLEGLGRRARDEGFDACDTMRAFYDRYLGLRDLPVPVVAAVNGHAIGAGLCVALAADLRVLAHEARVGLNFARLGLHPGMGATWFLPQLVGPERAAAWLLTGALVDGATAAAQGLALEAVPAAEVLSRALDLAQDIAASSPTVVRQLTAALRRSPGPGLDATLDAEAAAQAISFGSSDLAEGLAAVRERRRPRF